jgi:hypothetical protein
VWEKFVDACMDERTQSLMAEIHSIHLAYHHKPFNGSSEQHKKFLKSFYEKTKSLKEKHEYLDLEKELTFFSSAL